MFERICKTIGFLLAAAMFAFVGVIALQMLNYDLSAEAKANDVRLVIQRLKEKSAKIEEFRRTENRLPTNAEVNCDWKPCPKYSFRVWSIGSKEDGTFSLTYHSLGVPFAPVRPFDVTWHSGDGTTDYDGWDQAWRWHLRYTLFAFAALAVVLFPWGLLAVRQIRKKRRRQAVE